MHIGIYMDFAYSVDADGVSTEHAVALFAFELAERIGEVTLFGRLAPEPGRGPYALPSPCVHFEALPHYESLTHLGTLARAVGRSCTAFASALDRLDAVWLFTPSPLSLAFAAIARRRGVPVIFGVRQDTPQYFAHRLPSRRWVWVLPLAHGVDRLYRLLARRVPTTVVGSDLAEKFGADRNPVLEMGVSLVRRSDLVALDSAREKQWDGTLRVLTVSRLEPEKNPLLAADLLADLRSRDDRWTLDVAGEGSLTQALQERATELGVSDTLNIHGYVPNGAPLQALYRQAHALVHISLTEGLPQVIYEAQAAGLPIVGTDVGGVGAALLDGRAGLLVPPRNVTATAAALERLRDDADLRARLVEAGLRSVASQTLDAQVARVVAFIRDHAPRLEPHDRTLRAPRPRRRRQRRRSQVLTYHDVIEKPGDPAGGWSGPVADRYKVELPVFEEHLDRIAALGVSVGLLDDDGGGPDVALTFDDGGSSALLVADVLESRNWRGHFFITTDRIGSAGFLDADGVRALAERGHVIGSHSHTHPSYMARLPESQILEEWERSRDVLTDTIGSPPIVASLPGGMYSLAVARAAASAGYRLLLTSRPYSKACRFGDLAIVGRFPVRASTPSRQVTGYVRGSLVVEASTRLQWHAKQAAKRLAPELYRIVTRAPRERPSTPEEP